MVLRGCLLNEYSFQLISDMRGWLTESQRAAVIHRCPQPFPTREPRYVARPLSGAADPLLGAHSNPTGWLCQTS